MWPEEVVQTANQRERPLAHPQLVLGHMGMAGSQMGQECVKLSSMQRVATLKNLKYKIYVDLFNTFSVTA
jgi:hypothetical protein